MKRFITLTLLSVLFIGTISCNHSTKKIKTKIVDIPVTQVKIRDIPIEKEYVGQVYGTQDIPIRARVEGYLDGIYFVEGSHVKKGQKLYKIDSEEYLATVAIRKGELAEAKVGLVKANNDLGRIQPLAEINAVSQADLDEAIEAKGAAESVVNAAKASLHLAEINLGYTYISSPINGVIGRTKAKVGEFVGKDPNPVILDVVSKIDSVNVRFFINENDYLKFARFAAQKEIRTGIDQETQLTSEGLELIFSDNTVYKLKGKIDFINRNIDEKTGSILVQATFPNPYEILRPGQFAKVKSVIDVVENGMIIPQRCVTEFQGEYFVYVVNRENKVERRSVELGTTYKDYWVVDSGLKPDDQVVFEGLQKVKEGLAVHPEIVEFSSKIARK
ncbi:efflux RND transporter periplasmic adaptor subunit [Flammeovirga pectinis]|uniref:Efflux RND transporter periplasmic adaptor subunit n=1 Tax=Flammeovirga pectinis TaxID=2494373 RepID=A0A3S9P902_9BACT|nr:efflux RND transporter periplasmic adaptor subunit [Flammeovirga pectinis]AZQ64667.1 efflux RND transporter periplasmic adaptor subunit [Flammeovirga pectinis]